MIAIASTMSDTAALLQRVRRVYAPPPDLLVSEFSDQELVVTSGPLAGTRWQTAFAPYQRGILDAHHETGVEIVVVMGSSQWGKTACAVNVVAYHMKHDPCPILVIEPVVDPMAKDFARNRLEPMIDASPALREVVSKTRTKDASNTTLLKTYRGGFVAIGGANSAASLAARAVRLLILDEIDRYPAELPGEGSTLAIALKRTSAYRRRRRIMMLSSPTLVDGPIDTWFKRGDQRRYYVPCPHCREMNPYEWKNVRWIENDPRTARIHCPSCEYPIDDAQRVAILSLGEWRAENPERADRTVVSFHLWEAYSPLSSLTEIVSGFLRAREQQKGGDRAEMHTWQNTTLGEPIEPDEGEGLEAHFLVANRKPYPTDTDLPIPGCCVTAGVDVQDDRLELLVIGWGVGEESWFVDRHTLPGDTSQPEPWTMLEAVLQHEYRHESGVRIPIQATCIDSAGHRTTLVYDFAARWAAKRVYATIGRDGDRPIVSSPSPRRWGRQQRQVPLYTIGVDAAKSLFYSRLNITNPFAAIDQATPASVPGLVHLPLVDWCDEEMCEQLTSEKLVKRWHRGVPETRWVKRRARNEMLDCTVLAIAALRLLNPKLDQMARDLVTPKPPPTTPAAPRSGWVPRRPGWLKGNR